MILLVTGGRGFTDQALLFRELDRLALPRRPILVLEGGQRTKDDSGATIGGADYWANRWAAARGIRCETVQARWQDLTTPPVKIKTRTDGSQYNVLAGFARNQRMVDRRPDLVIGFPGGSGTRDCLDRARSAGLEVVEVTALAAIV